MRIVHVLEMLYVSTSLPSSLNSQWWRGTKYELSFNNFDNSTLHRFVLVLSKKEEITSVYERSSVKSSFSAISLCSGVKSSKLNRCNSESISYELVYHSKSSVLHPCPPLTDKISMFFALITLEIQIKCSSYSFSSIWREQMLETWNGCRAPSMRASFNFWQLDFIAFTLRKDMKKNPFYYLRRVNETLCRFFFLLRRHLFFK